MMRLSAVRWRYPLALLLAVMPGLLRADEPARPFAGSLLRTENLARLRPVTQVGMFSSYDRSGGNDDGFSGKDSFVRKEGDTLVLAELKGPGVITRVWTPTPTTDVIEFTFDDDSTPRVRMPILEMLRGTTPPFVPPLTYAGAGGYVSYVPLEFAKSIKVVLRAPKFQFYQINYALYEPGVPVRTYRAGDSFALPDESPKGEAVQGEHSIRPGHATTIFETSKPGRIAALRLGPADKLAGVDRALVLRMTWDGAATPAVEVPVGDFFGASFGEPAVRSRLIGTTNNSDYVYFPMAFDRSARIEMVSDGDGGQPVTVQSEVIVSDQPRRDDEAYFHAVWRREDPTTTGKPFTYLDVQGRGHVVGNIIQAQGVESGQTYFFEGDDEVTIDGEMTVHGTGSEDSFNGGWYDAPGRWYDRVSFPFSGCLDYKKPLGRTGAYRLFVGDAYAFRKSLLSTIEHGPAGNAIPTDYTGVTFFYLDRPEGVGPKLPAQPQRRVTAPQAIVLVPGWQTPIFAYSFDHATIAKAVERISNKEVRFFSLRPTGTPTFLGQFLALTADVPVEGNYEVSVEGINGPEVGKVQLLVNDQPFGEIVDFHATERAPGSPCPLGMIRLEKGLNHIFFSLVGDDEKSRGLGLDLVRIVLKPVR